ncbi:AbrB family transcriptional regulator [Raineyella fluvialis]|nr:AbrB family transcriptional regulator [Raineyella fluvialis]
MVTSGELHALGQEWAGVLAVTLLTLLISFGSGFLLALHPAVDRITGVLSMAAGGASGLVAVAADLGGDIRMVGTLQYTRVLLITASTPPVAAYVFHAPPAGVTAATSAAGRGIAVGLVCTVAGVLVARLSRVPAGDLLGPMIAAAAVSISGGLPAPVLPGIVVAVAYVMIGWSATLGFTRAALGVVARVLPLSLGLVLLLMGVSAVTGVWLARLAGLPDLDGYLATTPGGMMAVLAVAAASGGNVTFITGVQAVRLFLMLALTPLLTGWLRRRGRRTPETSPAGR